VDQCIHEFYTAQEGYGRTGKDGPPKQIIVSISYACKTTTPYTLQSNSSICCEYNIAQSYPMLNIVLKFPVKQDDQ